MANWIQELREKLAEILTKQKEQVTSNPPSGKYKVVNIYVDPDTGKTVVVYDDTPTP